MQKFAVGALLLFGILSTCDGDFYFVSAPKKMEFISNNAKSVKRYELAGIINFLMGLPSSYLHRTESWPGMKNMDVFNPPKANVLITLHLPKGSDFGLDEFVIKYTTEGLESSIPPIFELNTALIYDHGNNDAVESFVLQSQFPAFSPDDVDTEKIRARLALDTSIIHSLPNTPTVLNVDTDADLHVFGEIQMMLDAVENLKMTQNVRKQSIHVMLTSLDKIAQIYGASSQQMKEATNLLKYYIPQFIKTVKAKFHDNVLCEVDVTGAAPSVSDYLVRHSRSLLQTEGEQTTNFTTLNLAEPNTAEFAVVFNIVLWVMIGFFLAALATTYVMFYMDPGKDNIIYRVTSQRIKSD